MEVLGLQQRMGEEIAQLQARIKAAADENDKVRLDYGLLRSARAAVVADRLVPGLRAVAHLSSRPRRSTRTAR